MLLFYLNRYFRLSVPLGLVIGVYVGVLPLLVTQPTAAHLMAMNEAEECRRYWWRHLLYINIWRKEDGNTDGCLGQTWYLAFDMEWFLVSPLLVYPLWRTRLGPRQKALGLGWWSLLFLALVFWTILWVPDMAAVDTYNKQHYLPDWNYAPWGCRSHCYMLGLMMGYILHTTKDKNIRINRGVNIGLWTLAFLLGVAQVYGPYDVDTWLEYRAWMSLYKVSWGLCLSWVVFACVKGYGGPVNDLLSWGLWSPISKISFMTYLFHMSFNWYYFAMQDYNVDYSMWLLTEIFVAQVAVCLFIGLLGCLTLELPFGKIQKLLIQRLLGAK